MDDYVAVPTPKEFRDLLKRIFTDEFMKANTTFENFDGFKFSSAVMTNWEADQMVYSPEVFNHFIRESTKFETWEDMVKAATDEAFGK
ncbi:MAG: hypothetical protein IJ109_10125 [Firmicutes bacterium]|nr:hypothetical protein [Bacillota bacterium]